ncbi:hypothetical protein [Streptomyces flaveus]|uniref:Uncharacterized protein n=1 Tax=Streptomyces flaveus TaxID=66370 RepID=A0A917QW42_9ACTN|nr:hypothetical protein [Streptomyces flaveus]GGK72920.1 hypothetical protein GCM10010094_37440 [Streptomyces flaveus]
MSDAIHVILDDTAMVAAGRGNILASRLIHRASNEQGWFLYAPTCALVEADRARRGTAEHIASLDGITLLDLDLSSALAIAAEDTWAAAHARYAARPTPERPDGAFVATVAPDRWQGQRFIDLNP